MAVRRLVKQKGQTMLTDAEQKFQEGIISERQYQILRRGADIIE
jgi:hypothetical protein